MNSFSFLPDRDVRRTVGIPAHQGEHIAHKVAAGLLGAAVFAVFVAHRLTLHGQAAVHEAVQKGITGIFKFPVHLK